jgi:hypothetical protein
MKWASPPKCIDHVDWLLKFHLRWNVIELLLDLKNNLEDFDIGASIWSVISALTWTGMLTILWKRDPATAYTAQL